MGCINGLFKEVTAIKLSLMVLAAAGCYDNGPLEGIIEKGFKFIM